MDWIDEFVSQERRWHASIDRHQGRSHGSGNRIHAHKAQSDLCGGPLLCDIAMLVTNTKIPGVNRRPVGPALAKSNVRKALNVLRRCNQMSKRFLWNEDEY